MEQFAAPEEGFPWCPSSSPAPVPQHLTALLVPLQLWCLSVPSTGQISLLSQQKTKKKKRGGVGGNTTHLLQAQLSEGSMDTGIEAARVCARSNGWAALEMLGQLSTWRAMCCVCSRVRWHGFHGWTALRLVNEKNIRSLLNWMKQTQVAALLTFLYFLSSLWGVFSKTVLYFRSASAQRRLFPNSVWPPGKHIKVPYLLSDSCTAHMYIHVQLHTRRLFCEL